MDVRTQREAVEAATIELAKRISRHQVDLVGLHLREETVKQNLVDDHRRVVALEGMSRALRLRERDLEAREEAAR